MSDNKDKDKTPPSQFTEQQSQQDQNQGQQSQQEKDFKPTRGAIILTDEQMSDIKVVEKFTYEGVDYEPAPGMLSSLVFKMAKDLEIQSIASQVVQHLLNTGIQVSGPLQGNKQMNFPQFLAHMVADIIVQKMEASKIRSNIVLPGNVE